MFALEFVLWVPLDTQNRVTVLTSHLPGVGGTIVWPRGLSDFCVLTVGLYCEVSWCVSGIYENIIPFSLAKAILSVFFAGGGGFWLYAEMAFHFLVFLFSETRSHYILKIIFWRSIWKEKRWDCAENSARNSAHSHSELQWGNVSDTANDV